MALSVPGSSFPRMRWGCHLPRTSWGSGLGRTPQLPGKQEMKVSALTPPRPFCFWVRMLPKQQGSRHHFQLCGNIAGVLWHVTSSTPPPILDKGSRAGPLLAVSISFFFFLSKTLAACWLCTRPWVRFLVYNCDRTRCESYSHGGGKWMIIK